MCEFFHSIFNLVLNHPPTHTHTHTVEYKPDMKDSDPKSLFQQLIPTTFRALQDRLRERVRAAKREGVEAPIMEEAEFKQEFLGMFEDEEELQEAVYCLNLQGT